MTQTKKLWLWGALWLPLLLLLHACHRHPYWHMEAAHSSCRLFDSGRITRDASHCQNMQLEIYRTVCGYEILASANSKPLPSCKDNPHQVLLLMRVGTETHAFAAEKMQGGHKALLPPVARDLFIQTLVRGECVVLILAGYRETFDSANFPVVYTELQRLPFGYMSEDSSPAS